MPHATRDNLGYLLAKASQRRMSGYSRVSPKLQAASWLARFRSLHRVTTS